MGVSFYYFGTYLGLALSKNMPDAHRLMSTILNEHTTPVVKGDRLRPRLIAGGERSLLAVFNDNLEHEVTEAIQLPNSYRSARDITDDTPLEMTDGSVTVTVAPDSATVLVLE